MPDSVSGALAAALNGRVCIGEIVIRHVDGSFLLSHRRDETRENLPTSRNPEEAIEIAKYDNAKNYRPLKTAPNLRHGWRLELLELTDVQRALANFYPGRLAVFAEWKKGRLSTTPLRDTLNRQSGMYRIAAKISDSQLEDVVAGFCRSNGGCLRTILWKRDREASVASTKLPPEKYDVAHDQTGAAEKTIPLLCQEACNLLVAECRKVVKMENTGPSAP
jgi:sirohydrochlorin cobaltochelatase